MARAVPGLVLLASMVLAAAASASDGEALDARTHALAQQLRCVVCQNQTLADSNAPLALDLRREIHARLQAGASEAAVKDFLVQRYGDFVLYQPPLQPRTWLLWFGPFVLLVAVALALVRRRRAQAAAAPGPLDAAARGQLADLLRARETGDAERPAHGERRA